MLKKLKKEGKQGKPVEKDTKKDTKKKNEKPAQKFNEQDEDDAAANIVDVDFSKTQQTKPKQQPKKAQQSLLQEKDISAIKVPQKPKQEKKLNSWVPQSLQDAINFKSQVKLDETDFESLTDQQLNKQLKEKKVQKQQQQKTKNVQQKSHMKFAPIANNEIKVAQIQRTQQQKKMLQDDGLVFSTKKPTIVIAESKFATQASSAQFDGAIKFTPIQKTPQQLRQQQAQRKQQELKLKMKKEINNIQFKETQRQFINKNKPEGGFAAIQTDNKVKGTRRMDDDDGLVFLTKAQKQERKKQNQLKPKGQYKKRAQW